MRLRDARLDLLVIGAGAGGLVSALIAAGAGARVAIVERDRLGGDCLWTGCVPSKTLLATARLAHQMRSADGLGLPAHQPDIDFAAVMRRVRSAQAQIEPQDSADRLEAAGIEVVVGAARFVGADRVRVDDREIGFHRAILATGSRPTVPPLRGLERGLALTTDDLWGIESLPRRLAVLGGGAVGCELAQGFARLGSTVTIVEQLPRLLARDEPDAASVLEAALRSEGIALHTGTTVEEVEPLGETRGRLRLSQAETEPIEFDRLLIAAGRRPDTSALGLDAAKVGRDERGMVLVDERLRTTNPRIYAVGDVVGTMPHTHVAAMHARIATVNALFYGRGKADHSAVPSVTFTDPEVAHVGVSEEEARTRWQRRVRVSRFEMGELDRAITEGEPLGFAKLIADPRGRLVGATVVGAHAGEAIAELTAWIASGEKLARVSRTVHAYPTMAEGQARAADEYLRAGLSRPLMRLATRTLLQALRVVDRP